jgi:hypothetical protein
MLRGAGAGAVAAAIEDVIADALDDRR